MSLVGIYRLEYHLTYNDHYHIPQLTLHASCPSLFQFIYMYYEVLTCVSPSAANDKPVE